MGKDDNWQLLFVPNALLPEQLSTKVTILSEAKAEVQLGVTKVLSFKEVY